MGVYVVARIICEKQTQPRHLTMKLNSTHVEIRF